MSKTDRASGAAPPSPRTEYTVEDHHKLKTPIRWEGKGRTQKHVPPMFGQLFVKKLKKIYIFPGRIAWTDLNEEDETAQKLAAINNLRRGFSILSKMKTSLSAKAITFDILDEDDTTKVVDRHVILFETENSAKRFLAVLNQETTALQFQRLFSSVTLCEELNAKIKTRINKGETGLRDLFLSCDHPAGIHPTLEVIFGNLRNMNSVSTIDTALANSFVSLLSGISSDPIIFIMFHCFKLNRILISDFSNYFQHKKLEECISTLYSFDDLLKARNNSLLSNLGTSLVNKELERAEGKLPNVFIEFIEYLTEKVKDPKWIHQRHFLLALFQYPLAPASSSSTIEERASASASANAPPPPPPATMGSPSSSASGGNRERSSSIGRERTSSASMDFVGLDFKDLKSLDFTGLLTGGTRDSAGAAAAAAAAAHSSGAPAVKEIEYASVASHAVVTWAARFQPNTFSKLEINFDMLLRMLDPDSMYLYYILIKYYADYCNISSSGVNTNSSSSTIVSNSLSHIASSSASQSASKNNVKYMTMAMNAFTSLPVEYLYSVFQTSPNSPHKAWFMEFLFHPNVHSAIVPTAINPETGLAEAGGVFKAMLNAFQMSQSRSSTGQLQSYSTGYNRTFFELFLSEAFQRKNYKLAISVLMSVFFPPPFEELDEEALAACPEIAKVIFEALSNAMNRNTLSIMDETRLLLEIAIRFEYCTTVLGTVRRSTPVNVRDVKTIGLIISEPTAPTTTLSPQSPASGSSTPAKSPTAAQQAQQAQQAAAYEAKKLRHEQNRQNLIALLQTLSFSKYAGLVVQYFINHGEMQMRSMEAAAASAAFHSPQQSPDVSAGRRTSINGLILGVRKYDPGSSGSPGLMSVGSPTHRGRVLSNEEQLQQQSTDVTEDVLPRGPVTPGAAAITADVSSWKLRTGNQIVCLIYGYLTLLIDLYPMASHNTNTEITEMFERLPAKFYPFFNNSGSTAGGVSRGSLTDTSGESLKKSLVFFMIRRFNLPAQYFEMLYSHPLMFTQESHFNYDMMRALCFVPQQLTQQQCKLIISAALIVNECDKLHERVENTDIDVIPGEGTQIELILGAVADRIGDKLLSTSDIDNEAHSKPGEVLTDLLRCATLLARQVTKNPSQGSDLVSRVKLLLKEEPIVLWKSKLEALLQVE